MYIILKDALEAQKVAGTIRNLLQKGLVWDDARPTLILIVNGTEADVEILSAFGLKFHRATAPGKS